MKRYFCGLMALFMLMSFAPVSHAGGSEMEISQDGIDFIKENEGFSATAYLDNGVWRIGYGTKCEQDQYPRGITQKKALLLLMDELTEHEDKVRNYMTTNGVQLEQHQYDALVSFTYNLGSAWMASSYKFSSYLINGLDNYDQQTIMDGYVVWCHVGQRVDEGLANRRIAELRLFIYGDYTGESSPEYTYAVMNGNGGTIDNDIMCLPVGGTYSSLPTPTRDGYVFAGWINESTNRQVTSSTKVEGPIEVTAQWFMNVKTPFTDVPDTAWFYRYVGELYSKGVVNGMTPSTFVPQGTVNYGQALKLILLATGLEPSDEDSDGHWAQKYKNLAVDEGIMTPDFCTNLDAPITRANIAILASRAMGLKNEVGQSPFADTAADAVLALYGAGIVEGTTENDGITYFYPNNSITRAEISTIVWRILAHTENNSVSGQIQYGSHTLDILPTVKKYTYDDDNYYTKNGFLYYRGMETKVGIDVSSHQGEIDWKKVKKAGVDFAIIRVGGRGYGTAGNMYDDDYFERNIQGAIDAGIDVGVYYFSQAISVAEAREEARYVLEHIKGYSITYPVVYDWERIGGSDSRTYGLDTDTLCAAANAFCEMVKEAGYIPMVYFNSYCGYVKYDLSRVNSYDFWYARYNDTPGFYYDFDIWQYSDQGSVDGIKGRVDLDISFVDYSKR